jgi:hypothetical protein
MSRPPISRACPTAWTAAPSGGVRQRWPDLPVVPATGYAHVALPDGAVVVTKSYDLDGLAARIETARRRRR